MARTKSLTQQACEKEARKVLSKHGVVRWPVRVDRIAKARGTKIRYSPLDDELSGMAFYKEQLPIIGVNSKHHVNRQRFTIAHEIGHFCLHDEILQKGMHVDKVITMLKRDNKSSAGTINIEVEANQFAAELLMPTLLIKAYLDQESLDYRSASDEDIVESMAKAFKVSPTAMAYRVAKVF